MFKNICLWFLRWVVLPPFIVATFLFMFGTEGYLFILLCCYVVWIVLLLFFLACLDFTKDLDKALEQWREKMEPFDTKQPTKKKKVVVSRGRTEKLTEAEIYEADSVHADDENTLGW